MPDTNDLYFEITSEGKLLRIDNIVLAYPGTTDYDSTWLKGDVTIKGQIFSGKYASLFQKQDFQGLCEELKKLSADLKGQLLFSPIEDGLIFKINGDGLGHFEIACEANTHPTREESLKLSFSFDQTFLPGMIRQLETIIQAFNT